MLQTQAVGEAFTVYTTALIFETYAFFPTHMSVLERDFSFVPLLSLFVRLRSAMHTREDVWVVNWQ